MYVIIIYHLMKNYKYSYHEENYIQYPVCLA